VRQVRSRIARGVREFPWGELVLKVNKKVFVFLGSDTSEAPSMSVKPHESHDQALDVSGAVPTGYGLGRAGWVTVPLTSKEAPPGVLCDWVEESYRVVAPKRLVAASRRPARALLVAGCRSPGTR